MQARFASSLHALRVWFARNALGTLMAKATYEPLEKEEKSRLDCLCRKYPELAAEQEKFISFAEKFHPKTEELPFDLSGRLTAALEESSEPRQRYATISVTAVAVLVLAVSVYLVSTFSNKWNSSVPGSADIQMASAPSPFDELAACMQQAKVLEDKGDYLGAARLLEQAITKMPESSDPLIKGDLLQQLADIEYTCLQRYENAYLVYDDLSKNYSAIFDANKDIQNRYNLLAELRNEKSRPFYSLHSVRNDDDLFLAFQDIVAYYPATNIASVAVDEMRSIIKASRKSSEMNEVDELKLVRERCSNLTARAQVDLMLGHHYNDIANDRECALEYYILAAGSDHAALANQAYLALARMK